MKAADQMSQKPREKRKPHSTGEFNRGRSRNSGNVSGQFYRGVGGGGRKGGGGRRRGASGPPPAGGPKTLRSFFASYSERTILGQVLGVPLFGPIVATSGGRDSRRKPRHAGGGLRRGGQRRDDFWPGGVAIPGLGLLRLATSQDADKRLRSRARSSLSLTLPLAHSCFCPLPCLPTLLLRSFWPWPSLITLTALARCCSSVLAPSLAHGCDLSLARSPRPSLALARAQARRRARTCIFPRSLARSLTRLLAQSLARPCSRLSTATCWLATSRCCPSAWSLSLASRALAQVLAATCLLAPVLVSSLRARARAWAVDSCSLLRACSLL